MIQKRKRRKKSKNYFTQETEDYIVKYNNLDPVEDSEKRSRIYETYIHYAFFKLTQNIIHTFKFYHTEVSNLEHLQHEIITFLLSKIHLFDPTRGAKAFSYFGTIAKRYLIIQNAQNYKKRVDKAPLEELHHSLNHSYDMDYNPMEKDDLSDFLDKYLEYCTENIYNLFPKEKDAKVADAILEVFRKRESIDIFNKKAIYLYIREMVEVKTPHITRVADQLGDIFKDNFIFYKEHGYVNFE